MNARGSVFKYPDNVDTDVIIPARHLNTQDAKELASHCMEDIDKDFVNRVQPGDIMVGGWNFGCGSSREHAPLCIKTAGHPRRDQRQGVPRRALPALYPEHHLRRRPDEGHPEISPSAPTQTVRNPLRHRCAMPPPPKGGGLAYLSVRSIKAPPSGELLSAAKLRGFALPSGAPERAHPLAENRSHPGKISIICMHSGS